MRLLSRMPRPLACRMIIQGTVPEHILEPQRITVTDSDVMMLKLVEIRHSRDRFSSIYGIWGQRVLPV